MPASPIIWRPQDSRLDWNRATLDAELAQKASVIPFMELDLRERALGHEQSFDWARLNQGQEQFDVTSGQRRQEFDRDLELRREGFEFGKEEARRSSIKDFVDDILPRLDAKSRETASEALDELYEGYGLQPRLIEGEEEQPLNLRLGETGQDIETRLSERELTDRELRTQQTGERNVALEMKEREAADIKREDMAIDKLLKERQLTLQEKALSADTRIANARLAADIKKMRQGDADAAVDVLKLDRMLRKDGEDPLDPMFLKLAIQVLSAQFNAFGGLTDQPAKPESRIGITPKDKEDFWK